MLWTDEEKLQVDKYFNSNISLLTLYQRIFKINKSRTYDAVARYVRREREHGRIRESETAKDNLRIGYLDIEATNLNADFGFMLSWYIKARDKNQYDSALITKKEIFDYKFDSRIVKELLEALEHYDIIYAHYGSDRRFDIPFIRTRAFANNLEHLLPKNMEKFIMDTYPIARNKLKLHSNRLGSIAELLGVDNVKKTPLAIKQWQLGSVGHPDALKYIYTHNKRDVQVLERVHKKLELIEKKVYTSI